jgi:hypothetical protein
MRALTLTNLFVTLALVIYLLRSRRPRAPLARARAFQLGFASAFVANISLFVWLCMWSYFPPVFAGDHWKFLALTGISSISSFVAFFPVCSPGDQTAGCWL